jgi:hypothetical protein
LGLIGLAVPGDKKNVDPGRITITNPNNTSFGFKIKTTAPQQFCVKPCLGRIDAGQTVSGKQPACPWWCL